MRGSREATAEAIGLRSRLAKTLGGQDQSQTKKAI